ncbi:DUF226 domain-containing protein, partial [Borreliella garinii]|uniref:DUF226 domain-containing protein n=1 Tax=Borreliella garinii TaxID=29519 RepID=UPI001F3E9EE5
GIFYGFRKPIKKAFVKYEVNGNRKSYGFARAYYMEVRLSIFLFKFFSKISILRFTIFIVRFIFFSSVLFLKLKI